MVALALGDSRQRLAKLASSANHYALDRISGQESEIEYEQMQAGADFLIVRGAGFLRCPDDCGGYTRSRQNEPDPGKLSSN